MSKIFVRFTKESIESVYLGKEIVRDDGSKVRLFIATDPGEDFDRKSVLFVQTAIVESVSDDVTDIEIGDIAIVNYDLFNKTDHIVEGDENGVTYWLDPETAYCKKTVVAYANRKSGRDQIVQIAGEIDEVSFLLGVIRNNKLIARKPFIFLEHKSNIVQGVTKSGIVYEEKKKIFDRRVLASKHDKIKEGDKILVFDSDIFDVKLSDKTICCIYEIDVVAKLLDDRKYPIPL